MHVCKGGQISEVGAKFPRKYGPRGAKFSGGAKFPVTPERDESWDHFYALK